MGKIKVIVAYAWEFDEKQWNSTKEHLNHIEEDLKTKIEYNPVDMFYHLRQIHEPDLYGVKIEKK